MVEQIAPVEIAPVEVSVTAPDGTEGIVRQDDKAPTVIQPLEDVEVSEGNTATFSIAVSNAEQIYFTRDGELIEDEGRVIFSRTGDVHHMEICEVDSEDEGDYTVVAENQYGHVTSTATLLVTGSPAWISRMQLGFTSCFSCLCSQAFIIVFHVMDFFYHSDLSFHGVMLLRR